MLHQAEAQLAGGQAVPRAYRELGVSQQSGVLRLDQAKRLKDLERLSESFARHGASGRIHSDNGPCPRMPLLGVDVQVLVHESVAAGVMGD